MIQHCPVLIVLLPLTAALLCLLFSKFNKNLGSWLVIGSTADEGYLRIGDWRVETTGVLGRWTDAEGTQKTWAFPGWATMRR